MKRSKMFFSFIVLFLLLMSSAISNLFGGIFGTIRDVQGGRKDSDGKVKYDTFTPMMDFSSTTSNVEVLATKFAQQDY